MPATPYTFEKEPLYNTLNTPHATLPFGGTQQVVLGDVEMHDLLEEVVQRLVRVRHEQDLLLREVVVQQVHLEALSLTLYNSITQHAASVAFEVGSGADR